MIKLFFSYSHKDELLRDELDKHLTILKKTGIIDSWHDRRIEAGAEFKSEINSYLKESNIILLLVSSDFLASEYCYDLEMVTAMNMHENKKAVVIPVILRPCNWHEAPFGKLLSTPNDGKPVVKFPLQDEAFLEITNEISRVAKSLGQNFPKPLMPTDQKEQVVFLPRSSNLSITKEFSDHDKEKFLDDTFNYIVKYFEGSLNELNKRNPHVTFRVKMTDAETFTATIYTDGMKRSECMIFLGGMFSSKAISYSTRISTNKNSLNQSLTIIDDGNMLLLKPMGLNIGYNLPKNLTNEGAAEFYWSLFIEPLQSR